jgi:glucose/arabinose dehydrogenase/mono/diheme cytochrome c family protein
MATFSIRARAHVAAMVMTLALLVLGSCAAQNPGFHGAPASSKEMKNPYAGDHGDAVRSSYHVRCANCHGEKGEGMGNVPALNQGPAQAASDGELFWYISKGDAGNGMPAWDFISPRERWEIISYVRYLAGHNPGPPPATSTLAEYEPEGVDAPPAKYPFTDYRAETPGAFRKVTLNDLPEPFATSSAGNGPEVVPRPENAWPKVPKGFAVEKFADGLENPRLMRTAPNGDIFVAETHGGRIHVFRGMTDDGRPRLAEIFATGLNQPFGINFYPPGPNPQWIYIGDTDAVVRIPYQNGDLKAAGPPQFIVSLPSGHGHSTRDLQFSPDGKKMYVSVGSGSNVDDPDTTPREKNRADVLEFNPDGSAMRVYACGIRNCVGLELNPITSELWCSVNERDALGDNLVPDYITHIQDGGFYGWPWWYMGGHQDPRHEGKHPELKDKVITPDVILNPHFASLEMTFYSGQQFPAEYRGDIFASEHGSWNRNVRAGYELIRVPLHQTGHASGEYEDFMTGFVVDNEHVWGRPVGVTTAPDGSLLVSDDGSNSIWRITYTGK